MKILQEEDLILENYQKNGGMNPGGYPIMMTGSSKGNYSNREIGRRSKDDERSHVHSNSEVRRNQLLKKIEFRKVTQIASLI